MLVHPYLNFQGNTEEAFNFYKSVLGGEFAGVARFRDFKNNSMGIPEKELDKIANIALPLGNGTMLMGTDVLEGWPAVKVGTNTFITLDVDNEADAVRIYDGLAAGGRADMPLQRTEWAEKYGTCTDKFGVQWMVMYTGSVVFP